MAASTQSWHAPTGGPYLCSYLTIKDSPGFSRLLQLNPGNYGRGFSIFPLELWLMIFQYLREESPQHISRLAQTCKSFYQELNHVIYQPVRLRRLENARRFANTVLGNTCQGSETC